MGDIIRGITNAIGLTSEPQQISTPSAAEQAAASKDVAMWNAGLNRISQSTPFTNIDYQYMGNDASGVPQYKQITTFTQAGQNQVNNMIQAQNYASSLLPGVAAKAQQMMTSDAGAGIQTGYGENADTIQKAMDSYVTSGSTIINKQFNDQRKAIEQRLFDQGISANSDAYRTAVADFEKGRSDAIATLTFDSLQSASSRAQQAAAFNNQAVTQQFNLRQGAVATGQSLFNVLYGAGTGSTNMQAPAYAQVQGVDYNGIANRELQANMQNAANATTSDAAFNKLLTGALGYASGTTTFQDFTGLKPTTK